jgi:hypothetical protein
MFALPQEAGIIKRLRPAFTQPTFDRFVTLLIGAIVTMGRRTVSHILWSVRPLMDGHYSSYHRVFSRARWSTWALARILATAVVALVPADQPLVLSVDDTLAGHRGRRVYGKGCHRDGVRSSGQRTVFKWGHRWVVMAVNVTLPLCKRPWALPVLLTLFKPGPKKPKAPKTKNRKTKAKPWSKIKARRKGGPRPPRHKTVVNLARQMLAVMLHWFPDRKFILLGDWGYASHELAMFCMAHHVTLVARTRANMCLYARPVGHRVRHGRQRLKGRKLPSPAQLVQAAGTCRRKARVRWYGNSVRDVQLLSGCGLWFRGHGNGKAGRVPVRWVFVHEPQSDSDDYFYSTDPALSPEQIVEWFAARWAVEVTFEEAKGHLGFETTRQRTCRSVLRSAPCLMGLFSVVSLIYAEMAKTRKIELYRTPCYTKTAPTFTDALAMVRRLFWEEVILLHAPGGTLVTKLPVPIRELLLEHLTAAA